MKLIENDRVTNVLLGAAGSLLAAAITWGLSQLSGLPTIPVPAWLFATIIAGPIVYWIARKRLASHIETVAHKTFSCDRIVVDGKRFMECEFDRVTLIFKGDKMFGLERCKLAGTTFKFEKHAGTTVQQLLRLQVDPALRSWVAELFEITAHNNAMNEEHSNNPVR